MTSNFNPSNLKKSKKLKVVREDNDIKSYRMVDGIKIETVESFLQRGGTIEKVTKKDIEERNKLKKAA